MAVKKSERAVFLVVMEFDGAFQMTTRGSQVAHQQQRTAIREERAKEECGLPRIFRQG